MTLLKRLLIDQEASLFDTKEFLLKAFAAVLLGTVVGEMIPYVAKDMISLLFGMILTLEPVNLTGIRHGYDQVKATIFGAIITGIILSIFGYAGWTTALAVTATLYISLLINWREFSVVAVFTSIYMTQYIQTNHLGEPSVLATFQLRIIALLTGVGIALLMNWVFSIFAYRHMIEKRLYFLLQDLEKKMGQLGHMMTSKDYQEATQVMKSFAAYFSQLDWIYNTILDYKKDPLVIGKSKKIKKLNHLEAMAEIVREMTHLTYDYIYRGSKGEERYKFIKDYQLFLEQMKDLNRSMAQIIQGEDVGFVENKSNVENEVQFQSLIDHMNQLMYSYDRE